MSNKQNPSITPKIKVVPVNCATFSQLCEAIIGRNLGNNSTGTISRAKTGCCTTASAPVTAAMRVRSVMRLACSSCYIWEASAYNNMYYNLIIHLVIGIATALQLQSNYNYSLVHELALLSQPLLLTHRLHNLSQRPPLIQQFPLRKYELRDTGYHIDDSSLSQIDHQLLYQMEPPAGIFAFEVMSIENYHLLEIRQFHIALANPSMKFRLCVNEIVIDSEEVRRNDERGALPLCLAPAQQQVFNFSLYVASIHPALVRVTAYFLLEIFDGKLLVEEKAYARKIYATVAPNHLRLETTYFKKCPSNQVVTIHNYQTYEVGLKLQSRRRLQTVQGESIEGDIRLRPGKDIQIQLQGKATQIIVHSLQVNGIKPLPSLLMKTHCEEPLSIDYHNIGILADERMVVDLPLTVTSRSSDNITLFEIQLEATSETVELEGRKQLPPIIAPLSRSLPIAMMRIHSSKTPERRSTITVRIRYELNSEEKVAVQRFVYAEIRNAVSAGQRKFIDVTKPISTNKHLESRFPIKNNLNVPIYLNRISVDQSIFQLNWQADRRRLIYPNHSAQEFSLVYTGSLNLPLSSLKYLALLEFNGHLLIPLEITIYDHTLQCLYANVVHKCAALPPIDFGYFRDSAMKSKQLVVRNWNPQPKLLQLTLNQSQALEFGYNATLKVYRPGLGGDHQTRQSKFTMQFMLKAHQFLLLNIEMQPYDNATSGRITLELSTPNEVIKSEMIVRIENGTIALLPQVIRFTNSYSRQIQYINLVSTYSQQYNIRNVSTNLTGLSVHYNQPPAILENQWVGMSIVYDPFPDQSNLTNQIWSSSTQQLQYLQHRKAQQYQKLKYAKVKLYTTTDLQASSTVVIEEKFPQVILDAEPNPELEGVFEIKKMILKRKKKSNRKEERYSGQVRLTLVNPLETSIKYALHILSEPKFRDIDKTLKNYELYSTHEFEQGFFCVSEQLKSKHAITANMIKNLFKLEKLPEECSLELKNIQVFLFCSQKQRVTVQSNMTILYLAKSARNLCRICYRFTHRNYIHRFIDTQLPNKVLQEEGLTCLTQFIRLELNHLQDLSVFELDYSDIYSRIKEDFSKFCELYPDVMMFRYCHYLNSKILHVTDLANKSRLHFAHDKPLVLQPGQSHTVTLSITFPSGREKTQFFLVFANNFTQFETYSLTTYLQEPRIRIQSPQILLNQLDYSQENGVLEGERTFEIINEGSIGIQITHLGVEEKEVACSYREIWLNGLTCFEDEVRGGDWSARAPKSSAVLSRTYQGEPFQLKPHESYNLTVHFQFAIPREQLFRTSFFPVYPEQTRYAIYMYDEKGQYFKFDFTFKVGDRQLKDNLQKLSTKDFRRPLVSYHILNLMSLVLIYLLLPKLKNVETGRKKQNVIEERGENLEPYNKLYRMKKLSKIIREVTYSDTDSSIGLRLMKKQSERPVHHISEDLLLSVREVKQRQLKKYFNQSQESQIGGVIGFNHHLSLSHSMSYEQEEHDNNRQPSNEQNELIQLADSPRIGEESEGEIESEKLESSSSNLPEGQEVNLTDEIDQDLAWFDFNRQNSILANKSVSNILEEDHEFYNVFRSEMSLRKADNNYLPRRLKLD